ncbi:MAG: PucR family transcriptional regulator [Desulfitobacteriaceae bacterium]
MNKEWLLTIAEVLKRPLFRHAEVVAGSRGLARPIRWVHVLETAENACFLNGGELILSTGVGFGESPAKRLSYLNEVIQRKAVGLCIELGPYIPEIPFDMRELADHHEFPLVVFFQPVRFVDITLDLHESIVNRQTQALRELESYARDLQRLTLKTQSLPRILSHFQNMTHAQTFFLSHEGPTLFAPSMPKSVQEELTNLLRSALLTLQPVPQTGGRLPISDRKHCFYQPVIAMGNVLAYLGVIFYDNEPDEFFTLLLDYTATAIAQILLRKMFAQERTLDNENRLLEDILQGRAGTEEQLRSLMGISHKSLRIPHYWAAILEIPQEKPLYTEESDSPFHDLLAIFRFLLIKQGFRPLLRSKGQKLYLLLLVTGPEKNRRDFLLQAFKELEHACQQTLSSETLLHFGISNSSGDYGRVLQAFREAEQVLSILGEFQSPFFEDLGVYRILLQVGHDVLESFITDYLEPLLYYDQTHKSKLLDTLRVFLFYSLSKQEAADKLYIRRQTLYHRLEKIEELLGENYLKPENRLSLELALRAYDWLHRKAE